MIMDTNAIKQKIDALNAMVAADSVTPETVASILYDLLAALENVTLPDNVVTDDDIADVLRTGDVRNSLRGNETDKPVSVALVNSLFGNGYEFMGIAGTETAPYSTPEVVGLKLFYLAVEQGTYTKFGNKVKKSAASIMALISSDSGATWTAEESADLSVKSNGSTVYDLTKIDALTGGSSSADVKAAFTPLSGGSSRSVPQVGDILRTNGTDYPYDDIVVYAQSTDNGEGIKSFKYLSGAVIRTIQVMPDFSAVNVTETDLAKTGYEPKKYDYDKVMALTTESTETDIQAAFTPIGGSEPSTPTPGDLLVSTDGRNNAIILARQQTTASNASINIGYIYGNILRNISVRSNPRFSISVSDIELDKEVEKNGALRITTSNIDNITTGGSGSYDLGVTFQQLQDAISNNQLIMGNINGELYAATGGGSSVTLLSVAYLSNNWYSLVMTIPSYTGTTATVTVTARTTIPLSKIYNLPLEMVDEDTSVDIGISFNDLYNGAINGNIVAALSTNGLLYGVTASDSNNTRVIIALLTPQTYTVSDIKYIRTLAQYAVTDAGNDKVNISLGVDYAKAPCVDESTGKLPADVLPDAEPHVDFDLQTIQTLFGVLQLPHLLMICNKGDILSTDEIAFFRHKKTHILNNGYKGSGNPKRIFKSGWIRSTGLCFDQSLGENIYPFGIPKSLAIKPYTIFKYDEFGKDVWELRPLESEEEVSGLEDFYDFCQFGMTRESSEDTLTIRTGHGWMKKKITAADRVGVHRSITCGVAVYRNGKRVSDIKPFKIVFTKINETTDGIIDRNDIKVTFRV